MCDRRHTTYTQQHTQRTFDWPSVARNGRCGAAAAAFAVGVGQIKVKFAAAGAAACACVTSPRVASRKCCNLRPDDAVAAVTQRINHKIIASFARRIH